jgi:hypothetical protein
MRSCYRQSRIEVFKALYKFRPLSDIPTMHQFTIIIMKKFVKYVKSGKRRCINYFTDCTSDIVLTMSTVNNIQAIVIDWFYVVKVKYVKKKKLKKNT